MVLKVNGYVFLIIYACCSLIGNIGVFVVIALDFDGGFWLLIPAANVGLAVGGYWVAVGQILIDDAGDKHYGMVWGMSLLFNFLGMFFFDLLLLLATAPRLVILVLERDFAFNSFTMFHIFLNLDCNRILWSES